MKLHRFYVAGTELIEDLVINDDQYKHQWTKVLRFRVGREIALFNDQQVEYIYKITMIDKFGVRLQRLESVNPLVPKKDVYLCFSLLKKDKNDWVLQKATELGISHFAPHISNRTEKTGFNVERALKIVTEASEQSGRADIPRIYEPMPLNELIKTLQGTTTVFVAEQGADSAESLIESIEGPLAVLIGPEGGWTDEEKQLFIANQVAYFSISDYTLRAETAALAAATSFCR